MPARLCLISRQTLPSKPDVLAKAVDGASVLSRVTQKTGQVTQFRPVYRDGKHAAGFLGMFSFPFSVRDAELGSCL